MVDFIKEKGPVKPDTASRRDDVELSLNNELLNIHSEIDGDELDSLDDENMEENPLDEEDKKILDLYGEKAEIICNHSLQYANAHLSESFADANGNHA